MGCFKASGHPLAIYNDDEGALNSKKLQTFFQEEGMTKTHTKDAYKSGRNMIRTVTNDSVRTVTNDWGQIGTVQKQNIGGSAKAVVE